MLKKINKFLIKHSYKIGKIRRLLLLVLFGVFIYFSPILPTAPIQDIGIMIGALILTISFTKFK